MPTGVTDRLTPSYEVVYLLARSPRYFFDLDAARTLKTAPDGRHLLGRGPTDVWTIPTRPFRGHAATFPEELARIPTLTSCPEVVCERCGQPWRRAVRVERHDVQQPRVVRDRPADRHVRHYATRWTTWRERGDLIPCGCGAPTRPGLVLDPFFGTGTVGVVAKQLGRDFLGIELNPRYVAIATDRLGLDAGQAGRRAA